MMYNNVLMREVFARNNMQSLMINKNVELKSSFEWIKMSFNIFREAPLQFMVLTLFSVLIGLLPLFGSFMSPIFTARFANITAKIEAEMSVKFSELFDNLFAHKAVVRLGMINFCFGVVIFAAQYFVENNLGHGYDIQMALKSSFIMLMMFIPAMLIQMAMWLSPLICVDNPEIKPLDAIILSFKASIYNVATLFFYGLLVTAFTLLSLIPLGLGLLIWLPVTNITTYFVYKSVFITTSARYHID